MDCAAASQPPSMSAAIPPFRLSGTAVARADRSALLRDGSGRNLLGLAIEAKDDTGIEVRSARFGELMIVEGEAGAHTALRDDHAIADGADHILLLLNRSGRCDVARRGRTLALGPGDAAFIDHGAPYGWRKSAGTFWMLTLPRDLMAGLAPDLGHTLPAQVMAGNKGLALLDLYARTLDLVAKDGGEPLVAAHLVDLAILAFRSTIEAERRAKPTIEAVKRDLRANLARQNLSAEMVAGWYGVTVRTLQRLFERDGETLAGFILEERLTRAHARLADPMLSGRKIGAIARECGFSSPSNFNVAFRKRFGITPTELRGTPEAQ